MGFWIVASLLGDVFEEWSLDILQETGSNPQFIATIDHN